MRTLIIAAAALLFAITAAPAVAAPKPNMHLAWTKVERAWTVAARKHGAKVNCPAWAGGQGQPGKVVCKFTAGRTAWSADFQFFPSTCSVSMSFVEVAEPVGGKLLGIQKLSPCDKRWWLGVSSPWSYAA